MSSAYDEIEPNFSILPTCIQGSPSNSAPGTLNFPAEDVFCQLNTNDGSPNTVQGTYRILSGIFCVIERNMSFEYSTESNTQNGLLISETDSCFGAGGVDLDGNGSIGQSLAVSVFESAIPQATFEAFVGVQVGQVYDPNRAADIQIYLTDSNGVLALRVLQPGFQSLMDFSLNNNNDTFSLSLIHI